MNVWDVLLICCVALAVALAVRFMWRQRRSGGCASCPFAEKCQERHDERVGGAAGGRGACDRALTPPGNQ